MLTHAHRSRACRRGPARLRLSYLAGSAAMLALVAATPAAAQSAPADPPAPSGDAATGADIVVTAQKRAQSILDVPIAMSAFSGDRLEKSEIT